jgi:dipeptidyl aminopeptidase/acylaminoacyl peptidase
VILALPWWAPRLAGLPIKVFHGDRDDLVSVDESRAMVRAIESEGGHADLVVLPGRNHFILDVYEDPAFYDWLLQHRKE